MGTSFKRKTGMLAALLTVALLLAGLRTPSLAASSVIDGETGSLTIQPKYNSDAVSGCTFSLYRVAGIDRASAALKYSVDASFQGAGVDLNAAVGRGTSQAMEDAASRLASYTAKPAPAAAGVRGGEKTALPVGVYLAVQTGTPGNYTAASPFLVFLPYTGAGEGGTGTAWVYDVTAYPKLGLTYSPPGGGGDTPVVPAEPQEITTVKVVKKWDDAGNESKRPSSVTVVLLRDGEEYAAETLSSANGWQHTWSGLSEGSNWTVDENGVPDGYTSLIDSAADGDTCTYTITNSYGEVPLSGALFVTKTWNDKGNEKKRPASVKAGLYCDGRLTQTAVLNAGNGWSYSWAGLDENKTWTVAEVGVADGYRSSVRQTGSAFTITNTYGAGGGTAEIPDEGVPGAGVPQTGLVQWPIPVLSAAGALLIAGGLLRGRRKSHE